MKRESRTVDRSDQVDSLTQRHLALVDLLVDTRSELMELAVASGLKGLQAMLEDDRTATCGPAISASDGASGLARRHRASEVVLGDRKVARRRPRVRANGEEVPLPTFQADGQRGSAESSRGRADARGRGDAPVCAQSRTVAGDDGQPRHQQERREPPVRREDRGAARRLAVRPRSRRSTSRRS